MDPSSSSDSNTEQGSQEETIISLQAVTDTSSVSQENLDGEQPDPNTEQGSQEETIISLQAVTDTSSVSQENLGGEQPDPNTEQGSQEETIISLQAVTDTSSVSQENLDGEQPDPNTKQGSQVEIELVSYTSSDSKTNLGGNIQPDPNTEQGYQEETIIPLQAITDTSSVSQENLGGAQPDPNTEQGSQEETIIPLQAVTDTSSVSQENLGGAQPENNLQQNEEYWKYIPLVKATLAGNWESAKKFSEEHENALRVPITKSSETALHIAVGTGKSLHFVKHLVESMSLEELEWPDDEGFTALHTAALIDNTEAAKVLVGKHPKLVYICRSINYLPIHVAAMHGRKKTLSYLLSVTEDRPVSSYLLSVTEDRPVSSPYRGESGIWLLVYIMTSKFYDVAWDLIHRYPELATLLFDFENVALASLAKAEDKSGRGLGNIALGSLAAKVSAFPSGSRLNFWDRIIYSCVPGKVESCCKHHNRGDIEDSRNTSPQKCNWARVLWENFFISAHKVSQKLHFIRWKVFEFAVPHIKDIREKKQMHDQALQLAKCVCKEIQSLNDSNAYESHAKGPLFKAARLGVHEVVEEIVDSFPSLVWARDKNNCSIFKWAILERHENVFNLLYHMSEHKSIIMNFKDNDGNTPLHWAGNLAPQNKLNLFPGAALQMQRELQWFEEVKKLVIPYYLDWKNGDKDTAEMVFTKKHKALVKEGEKWMTNTASSCTIVAVLIVTIAFAASISVPGGHNDANGLPILSNEMAFLVFAISNAFSLFTSTTSLLMFLSILTSTYAEKDFLFALPKRLIIGLVTLFFSITAMMIAFGSIVYLLFGYHKRWVLIITGVFTGIPIISFVCLESPLLLNLITSYGGGIFGKRSNRLFY
ncbi:uncharacterized protein LOC130756915 isoform X2 [Actinidia eriantha]|uniref:uncharacterized protein LOC130756915 isoform X2 n=1 Tax=Actinidia eriantha TaxID=165200 RepID=UPI002590547D|nr:uncharacterized protein LOC130756915 isoform X2 [Actinidia eriantha]